MKKIFLIFTCISFIFVAVAFADRNTATVTAYSSSQLIKTGEGLIYSVSFTASSNGGGFIIYDALTSPAIVGEELTNIKAEGSEVTALGSQFQDYTKKPLEFSTGLYLAINDGYAIIEYE